MQIIRVRPRFDPTFNYFYGDLFLYSAIEDPALRPNDEAESDYDGSLQSPYLPFVSDATCRSL